jgi:hypothetical protein
VKLRLDTAEKVIRSIGDPPHGILIASQTDDDRLVYAIDPQFEPPAEGMPGVILANAEGSVSVPVDTRAVVEAAFEGGPKSVAAVAHVAFSGLMTAARLAFENPVPDSVLLVRMAAALYAETLEAIHEVGEERGWPE